MKLYKKQFQTALCDFTAISDGKYIINLSFAKNNQTVFLSKYFKDATICDEDSVCLQCCEQINEYLSGKRNYFTVLTKLYGTPYQLKLWKTLKEIPYGKTVSYITLTRMVGQGGPRAAGTALSKNPIAIIYPCHRVIKSNGKLGGFAGGHNLDSIKQGLLKTEGIIINP